MPMQLGPARRMPAARAVAAMRAWVAAPSALTSAKPAENMISARTPLAAQACTAASAAAPGTAQMARSGAYGRSATLRQACRPWISPAPGFTGQIGPAKPLALR